MNATINIGFKAPREMAAAIDEQARSSDSDRSKLIRTAIRNYLSVRPAPKSEVQTAAGK